MPKRRIKPRPVGQPEVPLHLQKLRIKNTSPEEFRKRVLEVPFKGYEVEDLLDGRKICITKPGAKRVTDIMVWVIETPGTAPWRPSHGKIRKDLQAKLESDPSQGKAVIEALEKVYIGIDPEDILAENQDLGAGLPGYPTDLILKAYKWIWVQEDCNYPPPKFEGRAMSMRGIRELVQTFEDK